MPPTSTHNPRCRRQKWPKNRQIIDVSVWAEPESYKYLQVFLMFWILQQSINNFGFVTLQLFYCNLLFINYALIFFWVLYVWAQLSASSICLVELQNCLPFCLPFKPTGVYIDFNAYFSLLRTFLATPRGVRFRTRFQTLLSRSLLLWLLKLFSQFRKSIFAFVFAPTLILLLLLVLWQSKLLAQLRIIVHIFAKEVKAKN